MEWTWLKTTRRKLTGTTGLGLGSDTSQMRSLPPTWNSLICREGEAAAACVSVQPACAFASRVPLMWVKTPARRRSRVRRTPPPLMPLTAQLVKKGEDLACLSAGR